MKMNFFSKKKEADLHYAFNFTESELREILEIKKQRKNETLEPYYFELGWDFCVKTLVEQLNKRNEHELRSPKDN